MKSLLLLLLALAQTVALAQTPQWIWKSKSAANGEVRFFRKEFNLDAVPTKATLSVSCDDQAIVYVNGEEAGVSTAWKEPMVKPVTKLLHQGANVLAVRGTNEGGSAAVVVRLELELPGGAKSTIVSDDTWLCADQEAPGWHEADFKADGWAKPIVIAKLGDGPWGDVFSRDPKAKGKPKADAPTVATPPSELTTVSGFRVELILSADKEKHGSWVAMAIDDRGRLILGSQTGNKIIRLTVKDGKVLKDEDLKLPYEQPMGLLWANDSLYVNGQTKGEDGKTIHGIFRLHYSGGSDSFEQTEQILTWGGNSGAGEHGAHGMVVGPDHKLYVISGNFTDPPDNLAADSPHRNFADDLIAGRAEDGNGFGANRKPPGGFVLRMDADGKNPQMFCSGERNTYDLAFNGDGELFAFDSDMEWDWGMPWYRPIRVYHAVSGGDQGFREGTGKWPTYYPDSLPPVVNIGIGSPTGVVFGTGAKFPGKYQRALYVLDWTYGRLIATHLTPEGASYSGTWENFVAPSSLSGNGPKATLNLTDAMVGPDGDFYFTTGGRNTQGGLYRVVYAGPDSTAPVSGHDDAGREARDIRHKLEAFHGHEDPAALDAAWPQLGSPDRHLRYAARIAIESQPVASWRDRALAEQNQTAALTALLALARMGGKDAQPALLAALGRFEATKLNETDLLAKIRIAEVSVSRDGAFADASALIRDLDAVYPAKSIPLNRELSQTLITLKAPNAVPKTMALLAAAPTQEEQITYLLFLRQATVGWTPELRKAYFLWWANRGEGQHPPETLKWFADAGRPFANGSSFDNFLGNFHRDAVKTLSPEEIDKYQSFLAAYVPPANKKRGPAPKPRPMVKVWEMTDFENEFDNLKHGRDFKKGQEAFEVAQCSLCHRFGNEGGAVGPDLTSISARFTPHDILESIIDPSKVVSEQYANEEFALKDNGFAMGRIVGEKGEMLLVRPSLLAPTIQEVKKSDILTQQPSKISPMPPALLSTLTKEEVLDLLAYLASAGNPDFAAFK